MAAVDVWASGDAYEPYVGRWSRLVAAELLAWLAAPPGLRWLDVGCGTGAVTRTLLEHAAPREVVAVDASDGYVSYARARVGDARATFRAADAQRLPFGDDEFDMAVSGLVLNFVPDKGAMVREMARVTRPGGPIAAYVWDYGDRMELMRHFWDAAVERDPGAAELDEGHRFPIARPAALRDLLQGAGLAEVEVRALDVPTVFADFDDYWSPFLGGQGPAPGYCMSLPEARRAALREHIRGRLPARADGSIALIARAWAVRGVRRP
ncbi:MAG: methyltransferase domain-containing protein [Candidatus Rokubacteria bacterium]|nr:methyltransferase domain-containing protein [Candidatus Rokubacteria bacterium]